MTDTAGDTKFAEGTCVSRAVRAVTAEDAGVAGEDGNSEGNKGLAALGALVLFELFAGVVVPLEPAPLLEFDDPEPELPAGGITCVSN